MDINKPWHMAALKVLHAGIFACSFLLPIGLALPVYAQDTENAYTIDGLPNDASLVIGKVLEGITGGSYLNEGVPVTIDDRAARNLSVAAIGAPGFAPYNITIADYGLEDDAPVSFRLTAFIDFIDGFDRRVKHVFDAQYSIFDDGYLHIQDLKVAPVFPQKSKISMYFVPENKIPHSLLGDTANHAQLLELVLSKAVDVDRVLPDQSYFVFAFSMDWLAPLASISLLVSDNTDGLTGILAPTTSLYHQGWLAEMALLPAGDPARTKPYIKVVFDAGLENEPQPELAAVFDSPFVQKAQQTSQLQANKITAANPATNTMDTISVGGLLSLGNTTHAARVQQRLIDLGFLSAMADGKWGKTSREALRNFKLANGLENSAIWNMETQEFLMPN